MQIQVENEILEFPDGTADSVVSETIRKLFRQPIDASPPTALDLAPAVLQGLNETNPALFGPKATTEALSQTVGRPYAAAQQNLAAGIQTAGEAAPDMSLQGIFARQAEATKKGLIENKAPGAADYLSPAGQQVAGKAGEPLAQILNLLTSLLPLGIPGKKQSISPPVSQIFEPLAQRAASTERIVGGTERAGQAGHAAAQALAEKQALLEQAARVQQEMAQMPGDAGLTGAVVQRPQFAAGPQEHVPITNTNVPPDAFTQPRSTTGQPIPAGATKTTVSGEAVPSEMGLYQEAQRPTLQTKLEDLLGQAKTKGEYAADLIAQGRTEKGVVKNELLYPEGHGLTRLDSPADWLPAGRNTPDTPSDFAMKPPAQRALIDDSFEGDLVQLAKDNRPKPEGWRQLFRSMGDPVRNVLKEEPYSYPVMNAATQGAAQRAALEARGKGLLGETWEKLGKLKNKNQAGYRVLTKNVVKALEDRPHADAYLTTDLERDVFTRSKAVFDFYGPLLEEQGVKLRSNYFTHQLVGEKPLDPLYKNLPEVLKAGVEKQRSANLPYSTDVEAVMRNYVDAVSRSLAYKPAVKAYQSLGQQAPATERFLSAVLFPSDRSNSVASWIMRKRFDSFVRYNFINAFENKSQVQLALAQSDPKAAGLYKTLVSNRKELGLKADLERTFVHQAEDVGSIGKDMHGGNWLDQISFMGSELDNRIDSRAIGFAEELVNNPSFQLLKKQGMSDVAAAKQVLSNPEIRARGLQRADAITANTQFEMSSGFRPPAQEALAKSAITQPLGQFTRYPISSTEATIAALTKDGREITILTKGLAEEADAVAHLRSLRLMREGAKRAAKANPGERAGLEKMITSLTEDINGLEPIVAKLPQGTTANAMYRLGRLWGRSFFAKATKVVIAREIAKLGIGQEKDLEDELKMAAVRSAPGAGAVETGAKFSGMGGGYPLTWKNTAIDLAVLASPLRYLEAIPGRPVSRGLKELFKSKPERKPKEPRK